jgi:hypothetical protein
MKVKKTKTKLPKRKIIEPRDRYNPELDKYSNVNLFPEKVARANEILKKCPPPKDLFKL